MKIGIDVSQIVYKTGVSNYLKNLVEGMIRVDKKNEYVLFFSSLRQDFPNLILPSGSKVSIKKFKIPPVFLDILWNKLHILPIETFIGDVDIFITSDWTQPPTRRAKKASILYDLIVYKYPKEAHSKTEFSLKTLILSPNIVNTQRRANEWMRKEASLIFTISNSSKKDAVDILGLDERKMKVIYPGL